MVYPPGKSSVQVQQAETPLLRKTQGKLHIAFILFGGKAFHFIAFGNETQGIEVAQHIVGPYARLLQAGITAIDGDHAIEFHTQEMILVEIGGSHQSCCRHGHPSRSVLLEYHASGLDNRGPAWQG